jgi:hypothetical protein
MQGKKKKNSGKVPAWPPMELFEDKAEFFKGMEDDWQHIAQFGIWREAYEAVVSELREQG